MQNARLIEAQTGIKIARRNINNLRYADDTTLMAETEELKSLLMKVKEESESACLKLNIQRGRAPNPILSSSPTAHSPTPHPPWVPTARKRRGSGQAIHLLEGSWLTMALRHPALTHPATRMPKRKVSSAKGVVKEEPKRRSVS